jgi:hypothetical protein
MGKEAGGTERFGKQAGEAEPPTGKHPPPTKTNKFACVGGLCVPEVLYFYLDSKKTRPRITSKKAMTAIMPSTTRIRVLALSSRSSALLSLRTINPVFVIALGRKHEPGQVVNP